MLDARAHVAGDRIHCLICGQPFKAVCHHARLAHGISARDYKARFGLPLSRGVATPDSRAAWSAAITKTRSTGTIVNGSPPGGPHPQPAYAQQDMRRIDPQAVHSILQHLRAGLTLGEACALPGAPRWTWVHQALKRDDALRAQLAACIDALPFSQQARMKKLGARFAAAVAALPPCTHAEAAARLGVSEEAVRRQRQRQRAA